VLKRTSERGEIEFLVMTLWDSMDAIRKFAGDEPESAVVEPEAREALSDYDDFVRHYEVQEP
jgi:heme-degrading monooxygenase HmoA